MELLLRRRVVDINKEDQDGLTALAIASLDLHEDVVQILLQSEEVDVNKGYPLAIAASKGHEGVVRMLTTHSEIDVNQKRERGVTALHMAAQVGHEGVVRILTTHSKINVNQQKDVGGTALYMAAQNGHVLVVEILLKLPSIKVNLADINGVTPLMKAAQKGHINIVRLLLKHPDIDINAKTNERKDCALDVANMFGHETVARLLREASTANRVEFDFDPNEDPELAQAILMSLEEEQQPTHQSHTIPALSSEEAPHIDTIQSEARVTLGSPEVDLDNLTEEEMIEYALKLSLE